MLVVVVLALATASAALATKPGSGSSDGTGRVFVPNPVQDLGGQAHVVGGERRRQNLEGDLPLQLRIGGAINLAHPTRADGGDDLVGTEARAWDQGQWIR